MKLSNFSDTTIEAYLAGKLTGDELDGFEEQMLFDETLQHRISELDTLKKGLVANADQLLRGPKPSLWSQILNLMATPAWSMTATAMLVVVVVSNLLKPVEVSAPVVFSDIVYAEPTRSATTEIQVFVPDGQVMLSIDVLRFEGETVAVEWSEGMNPTDSRRLLAGYPVPESGVLNLALPALKSSQATLNVISAKQSMKILLQKQD